VHKTTHFSFYAREAKGNENSSTKKRIRIKEFEVDEKG
jgi:hypothetical protein